jgi:hypothetical protein
MVLAANVADTRDSIHIRSYSVPIATGNAGEGGGEQGHKSQQPNPRSDCDKFTLWVRVFGPEIVAGSAVAVPATNDTDCYWKFDFQVRTGCRPHFGSYAVKKIGHLMTWLAVAGASSTDVRACGLNTFSFSLFYQSGNRPGQLHGRRQGSHVERERQNIRD